MLIRGRSHTKRVDVDVPVVPVPNASKRYWEAGGRRPSTEPTRATARPGERANAELKNWRILRKIRSSPADATTLVNATLDQHVVDLVQVGEGDIAGLPITANSGSGSAPDLHRPAVEAGAGA